MTTSTKTPVKTSAKAILAATVLSLSTAACSSVYYGTLEQFGVEKRDVLVDRVKDARAEQADAQEVFTSALDEFRSLVDVDGGALEKKYDRLSTSYDRSKKQAADVRKRINDVETVGNKLFREWEKELKLYESADLRRRSERQLDLTRTEYTRLVSAMNKAADRMGPVLELYEDQVLFLKHNLNARAISSLDAERIKIESRVNDLIEEMNTAIAEADAFIATMG
ncbi:MAG: DUF2959 domain-containing protein [Pseudomonadota bacterium]